MFHYLQRSPKEILQIIYKLLNVIFDGELGGADLFPFSLKASLPNEYQFIFTNL